MKDAELDAYCNQVESHFFRLKGRPGMLSPEDFVRVRRWYEQGVPVEAALEGISTTFESQQAGRNAGIEEVNSLGYCETFVHQAVERRKNL
jgi:hypothetical protein